MPDRKTVLVVDDEPRYLGLVQINLETDGYDVITAMDGQQAVEAVANDKPDIVLLDVMMPVMDGFTACERIREFSSVPIIILTAKGEERDRVRGLDAGADDYIVKPFSAQELLARVPVADDVSPAHLACLTEGFSGADIERVVNEAGLLTVKEALLQGRPAADVRITQRQFLEAIEAMDPSSIRCERRLR
mgnify:CR=1 FL=1